MENNYDDVLLEKIFDCVSNNIDKILENKTIKEILDPETNSTTKNFLMDKRNTAVMADESRLREAYIRSLTTTLYLGLII